MQNIFIYIDDSGVFDLKNNRYFVYAGYVFFSTEEKRYAQRKYSSIEKQVKEQLQLTPQSELKSCDLKPKIKARLYRVMNEFNRFTDIIACEKVKSNIWSHKKHKQRFLDYTLKRTIKSIIIKGSKLDLFDIDNPVAVRIFFDEHTTATSGLYEFKEGIQEELINGTFNFNYNIFYPPILCKESIVDFKLCNSAKDTLIRASDVVANRSFYEFNFGGKCLSETIKKLNHFVISIYP